MKIIIAGSRDFNDYRLLETTMNELLKGVESIEIVSGKNKTRKQEGDHFIFCGADYLGESYAKSKNIPIKEFYPDWKKYGKAAGPIRNGQMAEYADALVAFWDGKSKGTKDMISQAKQKGLTVTVIRTDI